MLLTYCLGGGGGLFAFPLGLHSNGATAVRCCIWPPSFIYLFFFLYEVWLFFSFRSLLLTSVSETSECPNISVYFWDYTVHELKATTKSAIQKANFCENVCVALAYLPIPPSVHAQPYSHLKVNILMRSWYSWSLWVQCSLHVLIDWAWRRIGCRMFCRKIFSIFQ